MTSKNVALILARAGSKGVEHKNLKKIAGYSLIDWAYYAAIEARNVDMIMLSTDYEAAKFTHLDLVFRSRPANLCADKAQSFFAILDSIQYLASRGDDVDTVTLLEPPCPFRNGKLIDDVIDFYRASEASSVVTLKQVDDSHPIRMKKLDEKGCLKPVHDDFAEPEIGLPRQMQDLVYVRDTAVYVFDARQLIKGGNGLYGRDARGLLNKAFTCNVDNKADLLTARAVYEAYCSGTFELEVPKHIANAVTQHSN